MIEPTINLGARFEVRIEAGQVRLLLRVETGRTVSIDMNGKAARLLSDQLLAAAQRLN